MEIAKLNELRNKMHKQFVNRQPVDENTVVIKVGAASGIDESKALLMKLIDLVSDASSDALVMADVSFEKGVKVAANGAEKAYPDVTEANAESFVKEYFGKEA